jgi:hypothetical protein
VAEAVAEVVDITMVVTLALAAVVPLMQNRMRLTLWTREAQRSPVTARSLFTGLATSKDRLSSSFNGFANREAVFLSRL